MLDAEQRANWVQFLELKLKIADAHGKARFEQLKLSSEYAKLVITNLHLINAGGIVSVPALAQFVGLQAATDVRLYVIGPAIAGYVLGFVFALLCAFITYRNYQALSHGSEMHMLGDMVLLETISPNFEGDEHQASRDARNAFANATAVKLETTVTRTYVLGQVAGWLSFLFFLAASIWLAYSLAGSVTGTTPPRGP